MSVIANCVHFLFTKVLFKFYYHYEGVYFRSLLGYCDKTASIATPSACTCPSKVFLYGNTNINCGSIIIINPKAENGRFIMKRNSGAAEGLTIVTGNHSRKAGELYKTLSSKHIEDIDKDIIVEEDVWIGANVTLLPGTRIGRGANIGSGAVVRDIVPPYAIVVGNPAKIIGFCFTPDEVIIHEKALYPEAERLAIELLEKNYTKYFLKRLKEIKEYTKL